MKKTLSIFTRPVPMWLFALWIAGGMSVAALAAVPLYTGSLSVPATGTITDNQLSASQCIGTDASKKEASNANCVQSITGTANQVNASAATGAVTLSLPQSIATGSTVQFGKIGINGAVSGSDNAGFSITLPSASATLTREQSATDGASATYAISASTTEVRYWTNVDLTFGSQGNSTNGSTPDLKLSSGNATVKGNLQASSDGGTTRSYVGPAYTAAGAAVASTYHRVFTNCSAANPATSCAVTFSGAAVYASQTSYVCTVPTYTSSGVYSITGGGYGSNTNGSSTTFITGVVRGGDTNTWTVYGFCEGT